MRRVRPFGVVVCWFRVWWFTVIVLATMSTSSRQRSAFISDAKPGLAAQTNRGVPVVSFGLRRCDEPSVLLRMREERQFHPTKPKVALTHHFRYGVREADERILEFGVSFDYERP